MRHRLFYLILLLVSIHSNCFAGSTESVGSGSYDHPLLKVEWTVIVQEEKILLTGMLKNAGQGDIAGVELIARALYSDHSELGRERFLFIPNTIRSGGSAPFGMFYRIKDDKVPSKIECTVYLNREGSSTGLEQEFFAFTAIVSENKK